MLKGIQLTLLMGSGLGTPPPAPKILIESLISVQVTNSRNQSGFQLSFTVGKNSPIMTTLMPRGFFQPINTRVIIVVTLNGKANVLMDGLVTNQELSPSNDAGASTLTLTGEDLSIAMDLVQNIIPFPAMPDIAKIGILLAPYASLGILPLIIPPFVPTTKSPTEGFESQTKETDRSYIRSIAQRNGYVFYVQAGPAIGQSVAYFGPDVNIPNVQSALSVNLDVVTNVESISFSLDGLAKSIYAHTILDPFTKKIPIPIPIPNINPMRPPISAQPTRAKRFEIGDNMLDQDKDTGAAKKKADEVARDIVGRLLSTENKSVTASGSLDVMRYGQLLRARRLVAVRGAGQSYDGMYYVDSVTHDIKP
ncbi:MAG: hypothetical protein AAFP82_08330, partial [Bacteroidota bacterium]